MTVAEQTREHARRHPFLYEALRAGVLNYTAAARFLDIGDEETVAAALRRYEEELAYEAPTNDVRVTMETGLGPGEGDPLLAVGETSLVAGEGSLTGVLVTGNVSLDLFSRVIGRCIAESIPVEAAGYTTAALIVVVERRDGPQTIELIEDCTG